MLQNELIIWDTIILVRNMKMNSLNMNFNEIINLNDPINNRDAVTKQYVDNLGVYFNTVTLLNTHGSLITNSSGTLMTTGSMLSGCFTVHVKNLVLNGPAATFQIVKNEATNCGHVARIAQSVTTSHTTLNINWPAHSDPILFKNNTPYDGSYFIKII